MKQFFISTSHGKIGCYVVGEDKGKVPLLVVHGGPGFASMPQVVENFQKEHPVYFYDQWGSGISDKAKRKEDYSLDAFIAELDEVLDALTFEKVVLMGFSWGGGLVTAYMIQKKSPKVIGIILCAPLLNTESWDNDQKDNIGRMDISHRLAIEEGERTGIFGQEYEAAMMAYYKEHYCITEPWPSYVEESFATLNMDVYLTMWGPSEFTATGKLKDFDLLPFLSEISIPVLLTAGDRDEAGVNTMKKAQMLFSCGSLAILPNAGHLHQVDAPAIFCAVVDDFLKKLS